jgi:hypothetical protein
VDVIPSTAAPTFGLFLTPDAAGYDALRDQVTAAELAAMRDRMDAAAELLHGPPEHWVQTLRGLHADLGFDTFVLAPQGDVMNQIERFAREVAPGVRD